jgi:C_GCAxxG_C_C family probable redox protein
VEACSDEIHTDIPNVATGFGGGIGGSKAETCGALNGGIIAIGCLFGRRQPNDDKKTAYEAGAEFRRKFIESFGYSTCPKILEGFGEQENWIERKKLTVRAAGILYAILQDIIPEATGRRE